MVVFSTFTNRVIIA